MKFSFFKKGGAAPGGAGTKASVGRKVIVPLLAAALVTAGMFYVTCPALNIFNPGAWFLVFVFLLVFFVLSIPFGVSYSQADGLSFYGKPAKISVIAMAVLMVLFFLNTLYGVPLLHAKAYAKEGSERISTGDFSADVPLVQKGQVTDIAIMDTNTAAAMGKRQLGSLGTLATQYELGEFMTTTVNNQALKVAPLGYGSFWKWFNRQNEGIPGYVAVDPVNGSSSYVQFENAMYYSDTAWFGHQIARHIRFKNPTALFDNVHFEVDDSGNPYWVAIVYRHAVGLFDCAVPNGVITCDAVTGQCTRYDTENIPDWVSIAYSADDLVRLVNYAGEYTNGWLNSRMAKTDVFRTTEDYGYRVVDGNLNAFTGLTSAASDESNIAFVLCDEHTGKITRYDVYGAEEYSAELAAEGLVMNFGYTASFPSLINVEGRPVYVMALTDEGDLIKKYALVDLQDYTKASVGDTVAQTWQSFVEKYIESGAGVIEDPQQPQETVTVTFTLAQAPVLGSIAGDSYVYLIDKDGIIYRVKLEGAEKLLLAKEGDELKLIRTGSLGDGLYSARFEALEKAAGPVQVLPAEEEPTPAQS